MHFSFAAIASFARCKMKIETILTPAELPAPAQRDLRATACVGFDELGVAVSFSSYADDKIKTRRNRLAARSVLH